MPKRDIPFQQSDILHRHLNGAFSSCTTFVDTEDVDSFPNETMKETPVCPECGRKITGRSDKKFCSDECRVTFNNRIYREKRLELSLTNRHLLKNYAILSECFKAGRKILPVSSLLEKGFSFNCITSILGRCTEYDSLWVCCYAYAYTVDRDGNVRIKYVPEGSDGT